MRQLTEDVAADAVRIRPEHRRLNRSNKVRQASALAEAAVAAAAAPSDVSVASPARPWMGGRARRPASGMLGSGGSRRL